MKKFIAVLLVMLVASSSFNLFGQKISRQKQKSKKVLASKEIKTVKTEIKTTEIKNARAFSDGNGVFLKWQTDSEADLIGFNIYKTDGRENVRINKNLILSSMLRFGPSFGGGGDYNFFDDQGVFQNSYLIESVFSNGKKFFNNPVLPFYISDLKNISGGSTSEQLRQSKTSDQNIIESSKPGSPSKSIFKSVNQQSLSDPETQKWIESQPGVKISIKKEGFYRITRTELENAGFDVNASSNFWQLYKDGVEQAILVDPNDQYIEFYGAPVEDVLESDYQPYYLVVGANPGRRMSTRTVRPVGGTIPATTFYNLQTTSERIYYIGNILNGENTNYFGTFISDTPAAVNFNVTGIDYSIRKTEMYLTIQGSSLTPHLIQISVNGNVMGTVSGTDRQSMFLYFTIPTQFLNEGTNALELTSLGGSSDYSFFDKVSVDLQRKYQADQDQLSLVTNDQRACDITGFTSSGIRVFDITEDGNTTVLTGMSFNESNGLFSVNIPAYQTRKLFALTDSALKQVDSITQNNPTTWATSAHNGKLLIITHKNWLTEANAWAAYRQSDGFTVEVVDADDIYDGFNYGKLSAKAITDFVQYAKNNWQTPPSYVLLLGDATYDPRNYNGGGVFNFVPTKLVDTVYTESGSDDSLTDFNSDGLAEIPIGRIPARTPADVTHMLDKVMAFEATVAQGFSRGALCASDLPTGYDFAALCEGVMSELPPSINVMYVNRGDANAPSVLLNGLNSGKYIVNYSGHGHTTVWASSGFFSSPAALNLTNGDNLSIFTMLTCLNGYFVEIATPSLGEELLRAQNGGAVSTWSSSTLTTPFSQEIMARRFYNQIGVGNLTRLGDLINDSKTVLVGGRDVKVSWVLLGDPTLKVR